MKHSGTVLEVLGLLLVAVGAGLLHYSAGLIVGGVLMALYANYGLPYESDGEA